MSNNGSRGLGLGPGTVRFAFDDALLKADGHQFATVEEAISVLNPCNINGRSNFMAV